MPVTVKKDEQMYGHKNNCRSLLESKKISNDQELIQSDPTSCPQNQKLISRAKICDSKEKHRAMRSTTASNESSLVTKRKGVNNTI